MPVRREALSNVQAEINLTGELLLSQTAALEAQEKLRKATEAYHKARKALLPYDLTSAYGVAVWGSARIKPTSRYGKLIRNFAQDLVESSRTEDDAIPIPLRIVTGGGPGIMEAANLGAYRAVERVRHRDVKVMVINYGVHLSGLPDETINPYIVNQNGEQHPEFSTRKQRMLDLSHGVFIAAGGFGTLYEAFMAIQNKQAGHIEPDFPIIAHQFWESDLESIINTIYHERTRGKQIPLISEKDLRLIQFVRRPEEAIEIFLPLIRSWWKKTGSKVLWTK